MKSTKTALLKAMNAALEAEAQSRGFSVPVGPGKPSLPYVTTNSGATGAEVQIDKDLAWDEPTRTVQCASESLPEAMKLCEMVEERMSDARRLDMTAWGFRVVSQSTTSTYFEEVTDTGTIYYYNITCSFQLEPTA